MPLSLSLLQLRLQVVILCLCSLSTLVQQAKHGGMALCCPLRLPGNHLDTRVEENSIAVITFVHNVMCIRLT